MSATRLLVLGTQNRKKARELADLLSRHGFELCTLADFCSLSAVEENGDSFSVNAALKATTYARQLQLWVLAEDSGLSVDALHGAPGVFSARYAGPTADDLANNQRLLSELSETPTEKRTAQYVCHAVLADPRGRVRARCEQYCRGRIRHELAGAAGFGYDPLFEIVEYHRTFGQLGLAVKSLLGHRSRAIRALLPSLLELARAGQWK